MNAPSSRNNIVRWFFYYVCVLFWGGLWWWGSVHFCGLRTAQYAFVRVWLVVDVCVVSVLGLRCCYIDFLNSARWIIQLGVIVKGTTFYVGRFLTILVFGSSWRGFYRILALSVNLLSHAAVAPCSAKLLGQAPDILSWEKSFVALVNTLLSFTFTSICLLLLVVYILRITGYTRGEINVVVSISFWFPSVPLSVIFSNLSWIGQMNY